MDEWIALDFAIAGVSASVQQQPIWEGDSDLCFPIQKQVGQAYKCALHRIKKDDLMKVNGTLHRPETAFSHSDEGAIIATDVGSG